MKTTSPAQSPSEVLPPASNRAPRGTAAPPSAITCNGCDNWWTGLRSAHCSACHRSFTGVRGFDIHRVKGKCVDPAAIKTEKGAPVLVLANRSWPGWSEPGTWVGPA